MHRPSLFVLAAVFSTAQLLADLEMTLYDPFRTPAGDETLTQQGWLPVASNLGDQHYFYSGAKGLTHFNSFPVTDRGAWTTVGLFTGNALHPASQVHDSESGFTLHFDLAIDEENHDLGIDLDDDGVADDAGFSILLLDSNALGVGLNFWENRIWTSSDRFFGDTALLPQAESVAQEPAEMATLRHYALTILRGAYRLTVNGKPILEGPTRDYDLFSLPIQPFDKPNIINIGDPSGTAGARARIGAIRIETCFLPDDPLILDLSSGQSGIDLRWRSVPGATYTIQSSPDLRNWSTLRTVAADAFSSSHREPFSSGPTTRFFRVLEFLP